jgi:hypothetical protein
LLRTSLGDFEYFAANKGQLLPPIVGGRLRQAWSIYFRYFLFRSSGHTQQQIIDAGDFLNFSITWEDAERVYNELLKNPTISKAMAEGFSSQASLLAAAKSILGSFKHP